MTIAFVNQGNALLPEIDAYMSFFSSYPKIETYKICAGEPEPRHTDVEWIFMGTQYKRTPGAVTIHEYASASTSPFKTLKNFLKKTLNTKPDFRIFFSDYVYKKFSFSDGVPYGFRGHGILIEPVKTEQEPLYDFIYVGTTHKSRNLDKLFDSFRSGAMQERSLLVVSHDYFGMLPKFKHCRNIFFKGPVPYIHIYSYIKQARYGINYIPDKPPYNHQISSKLIDYSACKIPVVTTDYEWVRNFQSSYGGKFFFIEENLSNFTWDNVRNFEYKDATVSTLSWESQITSSGIISFLSNKFPDAFS